MSAVIQFISLLGAAITVFALWRMLAALRRGDRRELVMGWFAVMVFVSLGVLVIARLL